MAGCKFTTKINQKGDQMAAFFHATLLIELSDAFWSAR
ncbi:hypothetical protein OA39_04520 [Vibrio campbellii]|nr:hypothetical protein OA39_04520 [Vibrio campbellii]CAE6922765.1 hypothetical protein ACOMICROBIO_LKFPLAJE_02769 [Vibrio sp. B1FIG11]